MESNVGRHSQETMKIWAIARSSRRHAENFRRSWERRAGRVATSMAQNAGSRAVVNSPWRVTTDLGWKIGIDTSDDVGIASLVLVAKRTTTIQIAYMYITR